MPYFNLREQIKLQDRPGHFIIIGPGIVEVSDQVSKNGFLNLIGKPISNPFAEKVDGETISEDIVQPTPPSSANDLNPGKKPMEQKVAVPPVTPLPGPTKAFGAGPKTLAQLEAEKPSNTVSTPQEDKTNQLSKTLPVKPATATTPPESAVSETKT